MTGFLHSEGMGIGTRDPRLPLMIAALLLAAGLLCRQGIAASVRAGEETQPPAAPRVIEKPTRIVRIPSVTLNYKSGAAAPISDPSALAIKPGREEQLPEGPRSFVVLSDGRFVIADPLRERLAIYSNEGIFKSELDVDAPVSEVLLEGELLRITIATDGTKRVVDLSGKAAADPARAGPQNEAVVALDPQRKIGTVRWKAGRAAEGSPETPPITVHTPSDNARLASLRVIAGGPGEPLWVAAEATSGRSADSLSTIVRRYSPAGALALEIRGIPLDYYVTPTTPFRVSRDTLYQLLPRRDRVAIYVWSTQDTPAGK